jgi:hypothetical protein
MRLNHSLGSHASAFYATVDLDSANDVYGSSASDPVPNTSLSTVLLEKFSEKRGLALEFAQCVKSRFKKEHGAGRTGESGFRIERRSRLDLEEPAAHTVRRKRQSCAKDRV